jgi:hypothetical protein
MIAETRLYGLVSSASVRQKTVVNEAMFAGGEPRAH